MFSYWNRRRFSRCAPDLVHRLDPFRHRAARFSDGAGREGWLFAQPDLLRTALSGHLWWTKWSPRREFVVLWIRTPHGDVIDDWILPEELDGELDDWEQGTFRLLGEVYSLEWLGPEESRAVQSWFGI